MNHSPHLPIGSQDDPRAPFNESNDLCSTCEREEIYHSYRKEYPLAEEIGEDGESLDPDAPELDEYFLRFGECRGCR
jgi:hypothetical protein